MATKDLSFLSELSATQDHFLKRFLVEACLKEELHHLSEPGCLANLGPPFTASEKTEKLDLPLLQYFFSHFVASFPFITNNPEQEQIAFWNDTIRPFIDSVNSKKLSNSTERKDNTTKRKQINARVLQTLLLFFNSMLSSKKELEYLTNDHLKPSDQGKLDKLALKEVLLKSAVGAIYTLHGLNEYSKMDYVSNTNIDVIAVELKQNEEPTATWSVFNPFSGAKSFKSHYSYIIQVTKRHKTEKGLTTYSSHFISKKFSDFEHLESALKKCFPGLMTSLNRLPRNIKNDKGVRIKAKNESPDISDSTSVHDDTLEVSLTRGDTHKYYREKHRLALRGYLCNLLGVPEIAHCDAFQNFLCDPSYTFYDLNARQLHDYNQRTQLEKNRLATQEEFQSRIANVVFHLSKNIEQFKEQIVLEPNLLNNVFQEIGTSQLILDLSPLLRTFIEWCKLEVAATLYQIFLTQDNSSEWFNKCRKFHRLFPYKVCYGILKYTNPVSIMSKIVDLLLLDIPSFGRKKGQVNNLLSMSFVMLLDEDLQDYSKERANHLHEPPLNVPEYDTFKARIDYFVNQMDFDQQEDIKEKSVEQGSDYLLEILSSDLVEPPLEESDKIVFEKFIKPSYDAYCLLEKSKKLEGTSVYLSLKQLWQLDIRTRDKNVLKQLWQEPELTRLIKNFLTVFYQPLMRVMKKCDVHLVFLDFQHFLDDLIAELTKLDEGGMYFTSSVEMFDRFKKILDKHEDGFWRFLRDLYLKDDSHLFINLIKWIESFLVALRTKFAEPEKVEIDFASMETAKPVNPQELIAELDEKIRIILEKRSLLKDYLEATATAHSLSDSSSMSGNEKDDEDFVTAKKAIGNKWNDINGSVFDVQARDLGLTKDEFAEFNFLAADETAKTGVNSRTAKVLQEIAKLNAATKQELGPELQKLTQATHLKIKDILHGAKEEDAC
ncbi:hypothetical protein PUMCH_003463 [Australozyma saopauloensis]|uniref:PX domain-containing protein n=1 Tax=Australozyma saopauloensis TaxID=291208 RepID=A0AAX4HC51_9ASCO|nr:hypothetical protein PUMCH_003463 [[Candida] saopauloensis]